MRLHVVHVTWIDSETDHGWDEWEPKNEEGLAHTIGILQGETDNYLVVAHSVDENYCNGRIAIPHGSIKDIKTICIIET